MKRPIIQFSVVVILVALVGCADESANKTADLNSDPPEMVAKSDSPEVSAKSDSLPDIESVFVVDHYDPERDAREDLKTTVELAAKSGKRILVEVGGKW